MMLNINSFTKSLLAMSFLLSVSSVQAMDEQKEITYTFTVRKLDKMHKQAPLQSDKFVKLSNGKSYQCEYVGRAHTHHTAISESILETKIPSKLLKDGTLNFHIDLREWNLILAQPTIYDISDEDN